MYGKCFVRLDKSTNARRSKSEKYLYQDANYNVIRRGCKVRLCVDKDFDEIGEQMVVRFSLRDGQISKLVPLNQNELETPTNKSFTLKQMSIKTEDSLYCTILIGEDELVGMWEIDIRGRNKVGDTIYSNSVSIFLIFNAFNEKDPTFVEDPSFVHSYINRQIDAVCYMTNEESSKPYIKQWDHSQFSREGVDVVCDLLHKLAKTKYLACDDRNDVVRLTRRLSYCVNEYLLFGDWKKKETEFNGKEIQPSRWQSSKDIFKRYLDDGERVKYGQCFTFAPLFTSVLRCLGIASRTVTCSNAGHDTNGSLVIERRLIRTNNGDVRSEQSEGIWNFHCWTEVWIRSKDIFKRYLDDGERVKYGQCFTFAPLFTSVLRCLGIASRTVTCSNAGHDTNGSLVIERRLIRTNNGDVRSEQSEDDLGNEFDGWQVLDATPQEVSDGLRQCGPYPVKALYKGEINLKYDGIYIFSQMNADVVDRILEFDESSGIYTDKGYSFDENHSHVGGMIVCPAKEYPLTVEDITLQYKPEEGTVEERQQYYKALHSTQGYSYEHPVAESDQNNAPNAAGQLIKIKTNSKAMSIGDPWQIEVSFSNFSANYIFSRYDVTVNTNDTNHDIYKIFDISEDMKLLPIRKTTKIFTVEAREYLVDNFTNNLIFIIRVETTNLQTNEVFLNLY
uniref:TGc domain-containing protein n=1 Tax=Rhabditophanes sp. KR3021 TaxID=114890 RepID=A0AC35TRZ7_9BILA